MSDGADVFAGNAFVEHGVGQHSEAGDVAILAAASGEDQAHVEHRQLMRFDEQHFRAFSSVPGLHIKLAAGRGLAVEFGQRLQFLAGLGVIQCFAGLAVSAWRQINRCGADHRDSNQAKQHQAWGFALTHESSPKAGRGRR